MSWSKQYPVNFVVDGDTTAEALAKHISEFERIYTLLNRVRNLDGGAVAPTDPESGALWLDSSGANGSLLKTYTGTAWAELNIGQNPIGAIIMYNGVVSSIPANWQLCDGTNNTPNMTDKFVLGTNTAGEIGNTGGSNDAVVVEHSHTIAHTHNIAHTHGTPNHAHTASSNTTGSHSHNVALGDTAGAYDYGTNIQQASINTGSRVFIANTSPDGSHSHTITVNSGGSGTTTSQSTNTSGDSSATHSGDIGVSGVDANRPAFVKLAYIQRMS